MPSNFHFKMFGGAFCLTIAIFTQVYGQNPKIDSLLSTEAKISTDTGRVNLYNKISWEYLSIDQKKFLAYAKRALDLAEKIQYLRGSIRAKNLIAIDYTETGKLQEAIELNLEALKLSEEINYLRGILTCNNDLGIIYAELGDYAKSLTHYLKVLEIETKPEKQYKVYANLSSLYFNMGNQKASDKYLELAVESAENSKDPKIISTMYLDRGYLEQSKKKYEKALELFEKGRIYAIQIHDRMTQLYAGIAIAEILFKQEKYKEALVEVEEAKRLHDLNGSPPVRHYIFRSSVYVKLGRYQEGVDLALVFLEKIKSQKSRPLLPRIYRTLAEGYLGLRQYPKAIEMQSAHLLIQDSLNKENNAETLARMETKFQIKEKEAENQVLKKEGEITEHELTLSRNLVKQQRIIAAGAAIGLLITVCLLYNVYRLLKTVRSTNQQLKEQSEHLKAAKIKAESAAKAKSEFLSVMSHEIRTPMNAVIGMTHLLLDEEPRKEQLEHLKVLQFSGNNLIALINDILDFSKIEAGKLELEQVEFDLKTLVSSTTASMQIKGVDKGIDVRYKYDEGLGDFYIGDSVRLGQVLINLMGNAVKFTEKGFVELQIGKAEAGKLSFRVIDSGIGIPEEKQAQVFDAFSQSSDDTTRKFGGTGLGLTISRRLVDLMESKLELESIEGEGSSFFFEIGLAPGQNRKKKINKTTLAKSTLKFGSLKGTKVLVAEDNKINQLVARKFLEKWDVDVTVVNNGLEAVEAWKAGDFDLILMDVQMPVMEGTEASEKIRELEAGATEKITILAFTACVLQDEIARLFDSGMDDWVSKPFDPAVFYQKIDKYRRIK